MRISRAIVPTVLLFSFTLSLAQFNLPVLIPEFESEFSITSAQAGMLMSVYIVSYVALQVPLGILADRVGGMRVVAVSGILIITVSLLGCLADSYDALLVVRVGIGLGCSACFPVCSGLIARNLPAERSAAAFGAFGVGLPLGSIVAMVFLPVLVEAESWRVGLLAAIPSALALVVLAVLMSRQEEVPREKSRLADIARGLKSMAGLPGFWSLVVINFVGAGIYVGMVTWLPTYLFDAHGLSLPLAGLITGFVVAMGIASSPAGGLTAGRIGRRTVILLTSASILVLSTGLVLSGNLVIATACAFCMGWFLYFHFGAYFSMVTELAGNKDASVKIGFYNCLGYSGTIVPPFLVGVLLDATGSFTIGFLPLVAMSAIGVVVAIRLRK